MTASIAANIAKLPELLLRPAPYSIAALILLFIPGNIHIGRSGFQLTRVRLAKATKYPAET